ncbi:MAG: hypothetical protein H6970_00590 [Gammaproteobacteria bacterium]|nr:hypothetical protein [Gammaproteobacteria bacterium]MCP5423557.1 hypothetical protein [Gammaproteobacteria bacterium]
MNRPSPHRLPSAPANPTATAHERRGKPAGNEKGVVTSPHGETTNTRVSTDNEYAKDFYCEWT